MKGSEVIAQFSMNEEFLLNRRNHLRNFIETDKIRRYLAKKARTSTVNSIKDLRTGMSHITLKAKILEVAEPKHIVTRYGNNASVAKVLIADETGTIKLCLWNEQIVSVAAGDTVQIENARAFMFRGERQLNLGKKGTINSVNAIRAQLKSMELSAAKT